MQKSGTDYGCNLYDGDINKPTSQAKIDKYNYIFNELKLKEGYNLFDIGCGNGHFMEFCQERGVNCYGMTISQKQAEIARSKGLNVDQGNINDFDPEKINTKFNAIVFLDSIEHFVPLSDSKNADKYYKKIFDSFKNITTDDSRIFISCLHQGKQRNFEQLLIARILDLSVSGYYPEYDNGLIKNINDFKLIKKKDRTEDYRLSGILPKMQWQKKNATKFSKSTILKYGIRAYLTDPFFLVKYSSSVTNYNPWLASFGKNNTIREYDTEYRKEVSYIFCLWLTFSKI